ncbi:hypothetical protein PUNSTDRAFT_134608 [Punctularia strigosozonata HHB-11173 SS5]|uniref:uncharacterized protein n=1 Tax=Punctularia strigosozonata (strain HHB-11173) TaxID=741275 RepID=UPI0004416D91|nr:uncharacterized protein PUNSTDRAFT_134608 [Punctularia strigosozonata HHB-11173 SS5]EIN08214.1 hypothetical protein PUNSTDRAFT_134608 [Punctularia strigosozonata HHB-11173 SS5]
MNLPTLLENVDMDAVPDMHEAPEPAVMDADHSAGPQGFASAFSFQSMGGPSNYFGLEPPYTDAWASFGQADLRPRVEEILDEEMVEEMLFSESAAPLTASGGSGEPNINDVEMDTHAPESGNDGFAAFTSTTTSYPTAGSTSFDSFFPISTNTFLPPSSTSFSTPTSITINVFASYTRPKPLAEDRSMEDITIPQSRRQVHEGPRPSETPFPSSPGDEWQDYIYNYQRVSPPRELNSLWFGLSASERPKGYGLPGADPDQEASLAARVELERQHEEYERCQEELAAQAKAHADERKTARKSHKRKTRDSEKRARREELAAYAARRSRVRRNTRRVLPSGLDFAQPAWSCMDGRVREGGPVRSSVGPARNVRKVVRWASSVMSRGEWRSWVAP